MRCSECGADWEEHGNSYQDKHDNTRHYCRQCGTRRKPSDDNEITMDELIRENQKLKRQNQKLQDSNRIERGSWRKGDREYNALEAYAQSIDEQLVEFGHTIGRVTPFSDETYPNFDEVGLIQVSDLHLNELIDRPHNKFDIVVASKRLHLLATEAIYTFKTRGIDNVVVAFTGDLLNSDRRVDERNNQALNRAKASVVAADLIIKFLLYIASEISNITVIATMGNEGRVDKDWSWTSELISNNYDFTIIAMTKKVIENSQMADSFFWGDIDQYETIVNINGQNVLFTHDVGKNTSKQTATQALIGRYKLQGIDVDCVFSGHIHATRNTDISYRCASLAGSNEFNENALNLAGRAAQNIAVFGKYHRNVTAIDLQNANGGMFEVDPGLMEYNIKSVDKLNRTLNILKVQN